MTLDGGYRRLSRLFPALVLQVRARGRLAGRWRWTRSRRWLFAAIGCTLGVVPHMLAAMLDLSGIMQAGAVAFETVRWAGVAYLVWMGVSLLRDGDGLRLDRRRASADPAVRRWLQRSLGALLVGFAARLAVSDR